ncbi:MAG: hypothetical protein K2J31_00920 [Alistipes sp.]|nr:hypothetical protein [Alistipes sp.]
MLRLRAVSSLLAVVLLSACNDDEVLEQPTPEPPFVEPVAEMIECTQANVIYYGDEGYTEVSDLWKLLLYTDMEIDGAGNPIGPGQIVCLSCNVKLADAPDAANLVGIYTATMSTSDFRPGTFNDGRMQSIDLPGGVVEIPDFSFFGDLAEGQTTFDADLLRDGYCQIQSNDDGTYTVSGIMVGTKYVKRYFTYTGAIEPVDRSEGNQEALPNTNLTGDVVFDGFTQARLQDLGDYFFLQDQSYRMFRLTLADEGVDISGSYPSGDGRFLKLEFFVEWEADVTQGMPVGVYQTCERADNGGIMRSEIVPWRTVPGKPDQFTNPDGSWYQSITSAGEMPEYARLLTGRVSVGDIAGVEGGRRIEVELMDCDTEQPHSVRCVVEMVGTQIRL